MGLTTLLIIILWGTLSTITFIEYLPQMQGLPFGAFLVCSLVFLVGGPVFGINQILTAILDCYFEEGWDDDG